MKQPHYAQIPSRTRLVIYSDLDGEGYMLALYSS